MNFRELYTVNGTPPETPQCEELRRYKYYNDPPNYKFHPDRCAFQSRYIIDGKYMCSKHAGGAALRYLLKSVANNEVQALSGQNLSSGAGQQPGDFGQNQKTSDPSAHNSADSEGSGHQSLDGETAPEYPGTASPPIARL